MKIKKRRDEKTMLKLILQIAEEDKRIKAVIMNGSRASPSAKKDVFQDYDIVYLVTDVKPFVKDKHWINQFGDILIMQTPDEMDGTWPKSNDKYSYLVHWNRIDLTLVQTSRLPTMQLDSQSILLLDKDNIIGKLKPPSDKDYLPKPPTAKEFADSCNEFLWVATYVAKGIWRKELTYAKYCSEQIVKSELIKQLLWYAGINTNYQITFGNYGRHLQNHLEPSMWNEFLKTYTDADYNNMWISLFKMCELFNKVALKISSYFGYPFDQEEFNDVIQYLYEVYDDRANNFRY